jgi:glycosyltransferase involved in cell wall biosynthesis
MRVLEVNSVAGKQSTGRIVSDLKNELIQRGHECMIAYGEVDSPDKNGNYHIGSELERYFHAGKSRIFDSSGFESKKATRKFIRKIETYKPDVVHFHNLHGYYLNIKILFEYFNRTNIPVVWTLHDCWTMTGHCSHFSYIGCEKWKTGCNTCPQKREYPASYFLDRSEKNFIKKKELFSSLKDMCIVTPSIWLSEIVKESYLSKFDCYVINNGVDTEMFCPDNVKKETGEKKIVLAVSSVWTILKGYNDLFEINRLLDDNIYQLVVIGVTKKQQNELQNEGIFSITRTNNQNELAEWYRKASVFINPTYEDTFPTVNIEALASGTPIVTYRTGGSPELVFDDCGIVVDVGNVKMLIDAVGSLKKNSQLCRSYGEKYSLTNTYKKYVDLLEKKAKFTQKK